MEAGSLDVAGKMSIIEIPPVGIGKGSAGAACVLRHTGDH
jgi:hypothetical protein